MKMASWTCVLNYEIDNIIAMEKNPLEKKKKLLLIAQSFSLLHM